MNSDEKKIKNVIKIINDASNKMLAKHKINDAGSSYSNALYGGMNYGGLYNSASGIGSYNDKSRQSFFLPTLLNSSSELETLYNESWAAKRFVNLPIEQMLIRPREFEGISENEIDGYTNYLKGYDLNKKLSRAMKGARLYGTAFLMFITKEAPLDEPLILEELQKGDLYNILVFDRYQTTPLNRNPDLRSKNYQKPTLYHVAPRLGGGFDIHESRILRFDGQQPISDDGWSVYDVNYGVSEIIPVLQSIYQDSQAANAVSQLMEEASIAVFKTQGFKETLGANPAPDSPTLVELANAANQFKSIYNAVYMDKEDEFSRQEVNLSGLGDVMNSFASRLAAAAGIPATVFLGKSPLGMNSTGQSDLEINAANVAAMQNEKLRPAYERIDAIMTRTSGLESTFAYEFPSLLDSSDKDQADVAYQKTQSVTALVASDIITTDEARDVINGDSILGTYEPETANFATEVENAKKEQSNGVENKDAKTINTIRDAVPSFKDYAIIDGDPSWDDKKARDQIKRKTGSTDKPSATYKNGFMYYDSSKPDNFGSYKLPYVYVVGDEFKVVPRAMYDKVALINGARGGINIPDSDKAEIKSQVVKYYKKMGKGNPFKK